MEVKVVVREIVAEKNAQDVEALKDAKNIEVAQLELIFL
jgi:hypothetical protein